MFGNLGAKKASRRCLEDIWSDSRTKMKPPRGGVRDLVRHQPGEPGPWGGVGEGFPLPRIGDWKGIPAISGSELGSTRPEAQGLGRF